MHHYSICPPVQHFERWFRFFCGERKYCWKIPKTSLTHSCGARTSWFPFCGQMRKVAVTNGTKLQSRLKKSYGSYDKMSNRATRVHSIPTSLLHHLKKKIHHQNWRRGGKIRLKRWTGCWVVGGVHVSECMASLQQHQYLKHEGSSSRWLLQFSMKWAKLLWPCYFYLHPNHVKQHPVFNCSLQFKAVAIFQRKSWCFRV